MLKGAAAFTDDDECMVVAKRPCTQGLGKQTAVYGYAAQVFEDDKAWSHDKFPWHFIHGHAFNLKLSEQHKTGLNIMLPRSVDAIEHDNVIPYCGLGTMLCTDRDGCGGTVQPGDALLWRCGALLHCVHSTPSACYSYKVMIVRIDSKHVGDVLNVENIVCAMFHVQPTPDSTEPCWLPRSITENHRNSWRQHAERFNEQGHKIQADALQKQQEMQAQLDIMQEKVRVYKKAIELIKEVVQCNVCHDLLPETKKCNMAPCGHLFCDRCFSDYFISIGNSIPRCSVCRTPAAKSSYRDFTGFTGVVAALKPTATLRD